MSKVLNRLCHTMDEQCGSERVPHGKQLAFELTVFIVEATQCLLTDLDSGTKKNTNFLTTVFL